MKKIIKYVIYSIITFAMLLVLVIVFSPYRKKEGSIQKMIVESIVINEKPNKIYNYLGNSDNAEDWSVYVDHISSLNPDAYSDGEIGSIRRCFKNKDEKGIYWDEEILITEKNERRRLSIFNMNGFGVETDKLVTEQLYREKDGKCEISFTLFYGNGKANWYDELKLYFAAYKVAYIFKGNLQKIKELNEI